MLVNVKNRSNNTVIYSIPDGNVRQIFAPGQVKQISVDELQKLTYQPGGSELIAGYLLVEDRKVLNKIMGVPQPEYWLDEAGVVRLLNEASMDEFLDCLDFAPPGVLDMIRQKAVELPVNDNRKREAIKDILKYDVTAVLQHEQEAKAAEKEENGDAEEPTEKKRRVNAEEPTPAPTPAAEKPRRYKVVSKGE